MADHSQRDLITRRSLIGATGVAAIAIATRAARSSGQGAPTPVITGDCRQEPGVELLVEWNLGLPVMTPVELVPPLTWVRYIHPTSPVTFLYPPDWIPVPLWAESISQSGTPVWVDQPVILPQLTSGRIVTPNQDAAFEFVGGIVNAIALAPTEAAQLAERGLLGEQVQLTPLCTFEHAHPVVPSWFHGMYAGPSILVTEGWPLPQSGVFGPATILTYYSMFGPQEQFEQLMRGVFIPILAQLRSGGGESGPTPTP